MSDYYTATIIISFVPRPFPPPVIHCFQYEIRPAVFHTGSDEILAVGMAWERSYYYSYFVPRCLAFPSIGQINKLATDVPSRYI